MRPPATPGPRWGGRCRWHTGPWAGLGARLHGRPWLGWGCFSTSGQSGRLSLDLEGADSAAHPGPWPPGSPLTRWPTSWRAGEAHTKLARGTWGEDEARVLGPHLPASRPHAGWQGTRPGRHSPPAAGVLSGKILSASGWRPPPLVPSDSALNWDQRDLGDELVQNPACGAQAPWASGQDPCILCLPASRPSRTTGQAGGSALVAAGQRAPFSTSEHNWVHSPGRREWWKLAHQQLSILKNLCQEPYLYFSKQPIPASPNRAPASLVHQTI